MAADRRSHDELRDLVALLQVGALTDEERADVEAHVETCAECAAIARSFQEISVGLAHAVPQVDPPFALRARIVGAVGARRPPRRASMSIAWLAAAAAALVAVALGAYALHLRGAIAGLDARLSEQTQRAGDDERQVADLRRQAAAAQAAMAVLTAPDVARIDLAGQAVAPRASGRAFWSRSRGLVFTASSLPPAGAGRTYQLWLVTAQAPISAGLLQTDANGNAETVFTPAAAVQPVAIAVTIEPAGGVPAPTGDKYLVGAVGGA